ncbi:MAG TPA: 30S ribosomal protein S1 [Clostridiales bacterium]|nr:30S ribosomal protein S1 [Clostridiales bacterium]
MNEQNTMMDLMEEIENSMKRIYKEDVLKGTIITVGDEEILVNLGYISDGIITKEEMIEDHIYKDGDEISVLVLNTNDGDGNVVLSHKRAEEIVGWDELEEAYDQKKKIRVKVTEAIKGGVSAVYRNVRCFIPGSLLSYRYVDDMSTYEGRELEVVVEDFDRESKRVVLSRKAIETTERKEKKKELMKQLQEGEMRQGVVTKLMKFGAFVDLGGVDGLIYLDDLAWHRVNDPSEVVSEGDQVTVYVAKVDKKKEKISLVLKKVEEDPWKGASDYYKVDDLVEGTVVKVLDFGVLVELEAGIEGLVHLSEISSERIQKPSDKVSIGDRVKAVILSIDEKNRKLSLSMKEAEGQVPEGINLEQNKQGPTLGDLFGDKFKDFFKE